MSGCSGLWDRLDRRLALITLVPWQKNVAHLRCCSLLFMDWLLHLHFLFMTHICVSDSLHLVLHAQRLFPFFSFLRRICFCSLPSCSRTHDIIQLLQHSTPLPISALTFVVLFNATVLIRTYTPLTFYIHVCMRICIFAQGTVLVFAIARTQLLCIVDRKYSRLLYWRVWGPFHRFGLC